MDDVGRWMYDTALALIMLADPFGLLFLLAALLGLLFVLAAGLRVGKSGFYFTDPLLVEFIEEVLKHHRESSTQSPIFPDARTYARRVYFAAALAPTAIILGQFLGSLL